MLSLLYVVCVCCCYFFVLFFIHSLLDVSGCFLSLALHLCLAHPPRLREWLLFILAYKFQKMVFRLHIQHTIKSLCLFGSCTHTERRAYNVKQIINLTGKLLPSCSFLCQSECTKCLCHRNHLMISALESKCNFCTVIYPKLLARRSLFVSPGLYLPFCLFTLLLCF